MKALCLTLLLVLISLSLADGPVPYVVRNTEAVKPVAVKPRKLTESECLATALYHEARGEPLEGQRAVYEVILHRAQAMRKSLCAVVTAPGQFFQWPGREGGKPIMAMTQPLKDLVARVKNHPRVLDDTKFRWYFNPSVVSPKWAANMDCHVNIGGHRFCREKEQLQEEDNTIWKSKENTGSGQES